MSNTIRVGALEYLTAENIETPHGFTTRLGGVSRGQLASLNLGMHRGDAPGNVEENFRILGEAVGFDPHKAVLSKQVHSDIIRVVGQQEHGAGLFAPELTPCDGLITNRPGTALVVFSADCTPVLLHDPVTGAVGAVHAGWRGTAADICGKAVADMCRQFGCRPENIRAAVGPCIAACCFETDQDVPEAMLAQYGSGIKTGIRCAGPKYFINLKDINAFSLRRAGVGSVEICPQCTACDKEHFWSHRKMGDARGSQGAVIVCKGGTP